MLPDIARVITASAAIDAIRPSHAAPASTRVNGTTNHGAPRSSRRKAYSANSGSPASNIAAAYSTKRIAIFSAPSIALIAP
ncbi:hypothetical protein [Burkholderia gladioli]|uniref:hypothetical protein n=1 Tax=Burkholderia gladioli TaxID=28095 RepID=UPI001640B449|nr:hypothetical protein [Burkholderia gladioli]